MHCYSPELLHALNTKTNSNVYLAADSVTTGSPTEVSTQTTFGERQISDRHISVAERALKIVVDGDMAIAMCGDFRTARNLASSLFQSYRRAPDPEAALRQMMLSNGPFPLRYDASLIVACRAKPYPRLFAFNHDTSASFKEASTGEGFQLGSIDSLHKGMTWELLKRLIQVETNHGPVAHLAAALGLLQSHGVHDYLLPKFVGGHFTGVAVTQSAILRQPDVLFLIDDIESNIWPAVATCVRDDCLIVNSSVTNDARVFTTDVVGSFDMQSWMNRWSEFAHSYITKLRFDFVVVLGVKHRVVLVVEQNRSHDSKLVRFTGTGPREGVSWFLLHADVVAGIRQGFADPQPDQVDFRFWYEPHPTTAAP